MIEVRLALAQQLGQTKLLAGPLVGATAERDKLAQQNAALRERAHAGTVPAKKGAKSNS